MSTTVPRTRPVTGPGGVTPLPLPEHASTRPASEVPATAAPAAAAETNARRFIRPTPLASAAYRRARLLAFADTRIPELLRTRERQLGRAAWSQTRRHEAEAVEIVQARALAEQHRESLLEEHVAELRGHVTGRGQQHRWQSHGRTIDVQRRQRRGEVPLPPLHLGDDQVHLLRLADRDRRRVGRVLVDAEELGDAVRSLVQPLRIVVVVAEQQAGVELPAVGIAHLAGDRVDVLKPDAANRV